MTSMSELSDERPWADEQAGWGSDLDERLAPLRIGAVGGLVLCLMLLGVGAAALRQNTESVDVPWVTIVSFALGVASFGIGGIAAVAFWVCRAVLAPQTTSRA